VTVRCRVCRAVVPLTFEQQHHTIPRAAGGRDGPTVSLCAGCHHDLHRVADMLQHGRAGLASDSVSLRFPDDRGARERLLTLARTVAEYMVLKRDGRVQSGEPLRVVVELPVDIKLAAQVIAHDHRGPTGRRLGLARWIAALVKTEVYSRYPGLDPQKRTHPR
jgi:hypothetical protein